MVEMTFKEFQDIFKDYGKERHFSDNGLRQLYDYLKIKESRENRNMYIDPFYLCRNYREKNGKLLKRKLVPKWEEVD